MIAVEGSAAGFVTAGGLDVQPETAVQARAISAPAVSTLVGSGDPLEDSLPEDAVELKGMVRKALMYGSIVVSESHG